ncbi:MAG TPA: hypothetical protein VN903_35865 [Polyangia bacterium]|jgi:hypothetical protein|nr:hypothetical protein [Polyangia bacterium]
MRNVINHTKTLIVSAAFLGLAGIAPAFVASVHAETGGAETAAVKPDMKKVTQHLKEHQKYPATRAELLAACNDLMDFSAGEKRWFADRLPEGTYKSAADVLKAINRK